MIYMLLYWTWPTGHLQLEKKQIIS